MPDLPRPTAARFQPAWSLLWTEEELQTLIASDKSLDLFVVPSAIAGWAPLINSDTPPGPAVTP